jgi:hypothetical protein
MGAKLRLVRCQVRPSGEFSASPDDEFGPWMNSLPCQSSASATYYAANPVDGHYAKLWHTSRDGSSNTLGGLLPHPSGALTSISAIGNLDVIPRKDVDERRKRAFSPYPGIVTTTTVWAASPPGARAYGQTRRPRPRLSAGNQLALVNNAVHRHVGRQGARTSLLRIQPRRASLRISPSCINRAREFLQGETDRQAGHSDKHCLLHPVFDIVTCLNQFNGLRDFPSPAVLVTPTTGTSVRVI